MSYIKNSIIKLKGFLPTKLKTNLKKFKKFNGYNDLDKKMLEFINYKDGFYVDCGANDGVNQSTTWFFEKYLNWKGLLIEPIPEVFKELKKNRNKDNYFVNCALTQKNYNNDFIEFYYNSKDTLKGGVKNNKSNNKINVKANTFDQVINQINYRDKIDFFSLDVEGNELNVLDGINFSKNHIEYILVETDNFMKLKKFLDAENYQFLKRLSNYKLLDKPDYGDYLFKRKK